LGEYSVLVLGFVLLVAIAGVAVFPCWPHSRKLGYGPSIAAGSLLVAAALLAVSHKADNSGPEGPTKVANTAATTARPPSD
jgi:hypothetical protein